MIHDSGHTTQGKMSLRVVRRVPIIENNLIIEQF